MNDVDQRTRGMDHCECTSSVHIRVRMRENNAVSCVYLIQMSPESKVSPRRYSKEYEVEVADSSYADYSANSLIENLDSQVDDFGSTFNIALEITDHKTGLT